MEKLSALQKTANSIKLQKFAKTPNHEYYLFINKCVSIVNNVIANKNYLEKKQNTYYVSDNALFAKKWLTQNRNYLSENQQKNLHLNFISERESNKYKVPKKKVIQKEKELTIANKLLKQKRSNITLDMFNLPQPDKQDQSSERLFLSEYIGTPVTALAKIVGLSINNSKAGKFHTQLLLQDIQFIPTSGMYKPKPVVMNSHIHIEITNYKFAKNIIQNYDYILFDGFVESYESKTKVPVLGYTWKRKYTIKLTNIQKMGTPVIENEKLIDLEPIVREKDIRIIPKEKKKGKNYA